MVREDRKHVPSDAERIVGRPLDAGIGPSGPIWANQRVTDDFQNAEVDFFLALPDAGFAS